MHCSEQSESEEIANAFKYYSQMLITQLCSEALKPCHENTIK